MKAENVFGPVSLQAKPDRNYSGIRIQVPFGGMFGCATKEQRRLRAWVKQKQLSEEGPYFLRYYHCDMAAIMDIEIGFVTAQSHLAEGDIRPGLLPAGTYATMLYRGNGLRANQAMMAWARDKGIRFDPIDPNLAESYVSRYEAYLTDYRVEPRKLLWEIELSLKIADS